MILKQLLVFGFLGISLNIANYLMYLWGVFLGLNPLISMTIAFFVGVFFSWLLHAKVTFSAQLSRATYSRMLIVYVIAYFINLALLSACVYLFDVSHAYAQAGIMVLIGLLLFIAQKFWVFK